MIKYFRQNWFFFSISSLLIGGFLYFFSKTDKKELEKKPEYVKVIKPKTDSVIQIIDSVLKLKKENELMKEMSFKKKQSELERELKKQKTEKVKKEKSKTKVVLETKEVLVEKIVVDTSNREIIRENYKIQEENRQLKQELEKKFHENEYLKKIKTYKDTVRIDTIKKKRKFLFF